MTLVIPTVITNTKQCSSSGSAVFRWMGIGLFVGGCLLVGRAWWTNDLSNRSKEWPTTPGTVVESNVQKKGKNGDARFRPIVRYVYAVGGVKYESTRVSLEKSKSRQSIAEEVCKKYPAESGVTVHYDPQSPGDALLELGSSDETVPLAIIGSTMLVFCGILFTRSLQRI